MRVLAVALLGVSAEVLKIGGPIQSSCAFQLFLWRVPLILEGFLDGEDVMSIRVSNISTRFEESGTGSSISYSNQCTEEPHWNSTEQKGFSHDQT